MDSSTPSEVTQRLSVALQGGAHAHGVAGQNHVESVVDRVHKIRSLNDRFTVLGRQNSPASRKRPAADFWRAASTERCFSAYHWISRQIHLHLIIVYKD